MKRIFILMAALLVGLTAVAQPKIVAHRGYWRTDGSAQNSITSLQKAAAVGCYGSEFDVWITADGVPVVFHDATIDGIRIEDTTFATLMNHRLQNGEFIPTLQQYLTEGSKIEGCQLILEIKPHRNEVRDKRIADMCVELVRTLGLEKKTEYISFSKVVCQRLHEITPDSKVAYLNGELSPAQIKEMGLTGIDYNEKVFVKHPEWLQEAKQLGVEVNVWTVDGEENLRHHANLQGVDLITTNDPEILKGILAEQEAAKQPASKKSKKK
ncbi:MAG: glycerophosphodiester phosphodiesterase family protein [Bacteroidaceae bacterium]|nr:glycerophosphodiester phosphodiesterase [Paraprevotella sp.]MDD7242879.1 glycerophosphodiester phosphodiesterase family protein [Paraprevotella sp.]MDY2715236.1 glycerophosphodiester phosphodiesterase family protein [Bacteroidaceae bacterium]MDY5688323.1 glycerophosphodiester phosphodiesterase family protein [Bacteroidaceae bacterium]